MIKKISLYFVLVGMCSALLGCDQFKVTPDSLQGQPIVGHWFVDLNENNGDDVFHQRLYLHIREDGYVFYMNLLCRKNPQNQTQSESRLKLDYMPIKRINVKKMVLQSYPLTPQFEILFGAWPDQNDGIFVVDKLPLNAVLVANMPNHQEWRCD